MKKELKRLKATLKLRKHSIYLGFYSILFLGGLVIVTSVESRYIAGVYSVVLVIASFFYIGFTKHYWTDPVEKNIELVTNDIASNEEQVGL